MTREVINELKKYTLGRKNTEKVEINVLQLNRIIKALEQEPKIVNLGDNVVYGTDGNLYKITVSSGKEYEQEPCEEELDFVQEHKKISCNLIVEPCEDAVSRQAVLDYIDKMPSELTADGRRMIRRRTLEKYISDTIPSVNPQPKTGYWILTSDDDCEYCTCSECGYQNGENWMIGSQIKFCQECGAKMVEPQESEGKK